MRLCGSDEKILAGLRAPKRRVTSKVPKLANKIGAITSECMRLPGGFEQCNNKCAVCA
ncbi:hypothetical protein GALMADRAFT_237398 [Galerina marginata CBS 339.88]|uniref:Uncharacterized protein n=1 Tax=Galerina marginata (strain CBS 339.88) TaxID=685588 RepID=A0A067TMS8_GALM3|nr:hypothetical protein GALMADRAFT_237398 [Galerina marginata CBS 339.88]